MINLKYPRDFFHKAYLHPPKLSRVESTQVESVELSTICQKVGAVLVDIVLISSLRLKPGSIIQRLPPPQSHSTQQSPNINPYLGYNDYYHLYHPHHPAPPQSGVPLPGTFSRQKPPSPYHSHPSHPQHLHPHPHPYPHPHPSSQNQKKHHLIMVHYPHKHPS